jgi:outer membrane protein assembly factor BamB
VTLLAPAIGPEGNRYVTTGRGPGTSHLHAFDADGNLLWESAPQQSLADLDSQAVGSSPLVDVAGHVYVSDANQFWSFRADGRLRWVAPLPPPDDPSLPGAPFISCTLTREGYVGGITTDGKVILFRRQNGKLALPIFALPKGVPPPSTLERPGLWAGGLMDPAILRFVEDWFFGDEAQVANTPSVHPETGRIYITAAGPLDPVTGDLTGVLYGLDIVDGAIQIAFAAPMGGGSGTSPTISPDGAQVYAADNLGVLRAFDAVTGAERWATAGIPLAGSPGLGADGTVYGGNSDPGAPATLVALDPADGSVKWQQSYDAFAANLIPALPPQPPLFPTGMPIARVNSVVSSSALRTWVVLTVGYEFFNPLTGTSLSQPRLTLLAALDPADGSILSFTPLRDTNEGLISIGSDGTLHLSLGSILSSIHFFAVNPLLQSLNFPAVYLFPGVPVGGVQVLEPVSVLDHVLEGIAWVRQLDAEALAELPGGDLEVAFAAVRRGRVQLEASAASVADAEAAGEIDAVTADATRAALHKATTLLTSARNLLGRGAVPPSKERVAARKIERADARLADAEDLLTP